MAKECSHHHHCSHHYHASAFGVAGEFRRPAQRSIAAQASTTLAPGGGRGVDRVENFQLDGTLSFRAAYTEVGGSFDECHNIHTSYACSVIEDLDIAGIVMADKVVSRIAVYAPEEGSKDELSFDITGSHFKNLTICGHPIDVKLATNEFHKYDTYLKFEQALQANKADHLLFLSGLSKLNGAKLQELEDEYHALHGVTKRVAGWTKSAAKTRSATRSATTYSCSAAGHLDLKGCVGANSELQGFGSIICVPKFGIIHLAEITINQDRRTLNMLRVEMCSAGDASIHTGGTSGGGTGAYP